jgi:hypothetical protein
LSARAERKVATIPGMKPPNHVLSMIAQKNTGVRKLSKYVSINRVITSATRTDVTATPQLRNVRPHRRQEGSRVDMAHPLSDLIRNVSRPVRARSIRLTIRPGLSA